MFAEDAKIYKEIKSKDDCASLQEDLDCLSAWSADSELSFNVTKCKVQTITRKRRPISASYQITGCVIKSTAAERDLGVSVSSDLTWNNQGYEQAARSNKLLGYIQRNARFTINTPERCTPYVGLVRPHINYATPVWATHSIELISKLESIQRRATKFILRLSFSTSIDYRTRLQSLKLLPITYWHEFLDMIFFYKATHNLVSMNGSVLLVKHVARTTRHTNTVIKFLPYNCKTTTYQIPFSSELVGFGHLSQYH